MATTYMVPKMVTCPRCTGDKVFHSSRTGRRAATASEPLMNTARDCPHCKGSGRVTIMITAAQAKEERETKAAAKKAEANAKKARAEADKATAKAEVAEAKTLL